MRKACSELLARYASLPGLTASCLRLPDGSISHECFTRWLTPTQVRQAMSILDGTLEVLRSSGVVPAQTNWVFANLRLMSRLRPDHACLAVFIENRPDLAMAKVNALLEEFAQLEAIAEL
ncbi:MAG TPA: hypothetical protein VKY92_15160 [Verrucomicrobiae bacterium]|nr:hypothetical protein [Verrucomicrobiae bacterium]